MNIEAKKNDGVIKILEKRGILPGHPDYIMYVDRFNDLAEIWMKKNGDSFQYEIIIDYSKEHTSNTFIDPAVRSHIREVQKEGKWKYEIRLIKYEGKTRPSEEINALDLLKAGSPEIIGAASLEHLLHFSPKFKEEGGPLIVLAPDQKRENLFLFRDSPSCSIEKVRMDFELKTYYLLFILREERIS